MPDWVALSAAALTDFEPAQQLAVIEKVEAWLVLDPQSALNACMMAARKELAPRTIAEALQAVGAALARDAGVPPPPAKTEYLQKLACDFQANRLAAPQRKLFIRLMIVASLMEALFEAYRELAQPDSGLLVKDDVSIERLYESLHVRYNKIIENTVNGRLTIQNLGSITTLVADYDALLRQVPNTYVSRPVIASSAGGAAMFLARGLAELGRFERAVAVYSDAAAFFHEAAEPANAREAANQSERIQHIGLADIDRASLPALKSLVRGEINPLARAKARARLIEAAQQAHAIYEAGLQAEECVKDLEAAGYSDPCVLPIHEAIDGWVATITKRATGSDVDAMFFEAIHLYKHVFAARLQTRAVSDDGAEQLRDRVRAITDMLLEGVAQLSAAKDGVAARLERYMYSLPDSKVAPDSPIVDTGRQHIIEARILYDRFAAMRAESDVAKQRQDPRAIAKLARESFRLITKSATLDDVRLQSFAYITNAHIRMRLGDFLGAIDAVRRGEYLIFGEVRPDVSQPANPLEFEAFLILRLERVDAIFALRDWQELLDVAEDTIRRIERCRYRISDPFQQASFLENRTRFYELAIYASFRLRQFNRLLSAMELIKSQAALRNRLAPLPDVSTTEVAERLAKSAKAMTEAQPGTPEHSAALLDRRLLSNLLAILRHGGADDANLPALSIEAIQSSLADDEIVLSWVWMNRMTLILMGLSRGRLMVEQITLAGSDRARLDAYIRCLTPDPPRGRILDQEITYLCSVLLPQTAIRFIQTAKRLILSPHRELHLVPFHAAIIAGNPLILRTAVRYVPNVGSLLVPWSGGSGGLLSIGIEHFAVPGRHLPDLSRAETEARDVAAVWSRHFSESEPPLIGRDATAATLEALRDRISTYRCIHLATHATSVFDREAADDPSASALMLQDTAIDALQISQLRLGAEVVILAACHSGQRALRARGLTELPGDDVFGLQSALFEAGACGVLGALWPVHDESAAILMPLIHEGLARGLAPELALQYGLQAYLRRPDTRHGAYFWGSLFLSSLGRPT